MQWIVTYGCKLGWKLCAGSMPKNYRKFANRAADRFYQSHRNGGSTAPLYPICATQKLTAIAKIETWDNWFLNWVFTLWNIIPSAAAKRIWPRCTITGYAGKGYILGISPEGTRSREGKLLRARGGIAMLACTASAVTAVAHWGGENFGRNVKNSSGQISTSRRADLLSGCAR